MLSPRQSPDGLEDGAPGYGETRIQGRGGEELPTALPMEEGGRSFGGSRNVRRLIRPLLSQVFSSSRTRPLGP